VTRVTGLPTLVVVSGPAGSGKTTLAHRLALAVGCPLISRDEIKEGMVHASPGFVPAVGDELTARTLPVFFSVLELLLRAGVTTVAERQVRLGQPELVVRPPHPGLILDRAAEDVVDEGDGEGQILGPAFQAVQVEEELGDSGRAAAAGPTGRQTSPGGCPSSGRPRARRRASARLPWSGRPPRRTSPDPRSPTPARDRPRRRPPAERASTSPPGSARRWRAATPPSARQRQGMTQLAA